MGVSGFAGFLRRQYPGAYRVLSEEEAVCDNLYIDLASTLHQTLRKARTRAYFHFLLHKRLDAILATCKPRKRVVIAMDGPAPLAKLLEQRRRRRREAGRQVRTGAAGRGGAGAGSPAAASQQQQPSSLSALMLTTGTPLMLELHQSLAYYICKRLADPETEHLQFELSDSTVKGEGELKILQRLLQGAGSSSSDPDAQPESHMVLGGDSDLLLMAMVSGRERVFICDDSQDFIADVAAEEAEAGAGAGVPLADAASPAAASLASSGGGSGLGSAAEAEAGGRDGAVAATAGGAGSSSSSSSSSRDGNGNGGPKGSGRRKSGGGGHKWGRAPRGSFQEEEGSGKGLHVFSRDQLAELWQQEHLSSGSSRSGGSSEVLGMSLDLALLAIMCGGNDYLPGMQGLQMVCKHRPGIWNLYLEMRSEPQWRGRRLVQRRGSAHKPHARINAPALAELLQRYHDRRVQVVPPDLVMSTSSEESSSEEEEETEEDQLLEGLLSMEEGGGGPGEKQRLGRALVRLRQRLLQPPRLASAGGDAAALIEAGGGGEKRRTRGWSRLSEEGISRHRSCGPGCECDEYCSPRSRKQHSTRGEANATAYVKGLEWVLGMYMRGHVSDYRFTYDMSAPPLLDLLGHLWVKADSSSAQALRAAVAGTAAAGAPGRYTALELWGMSEGEEEGRFEGYASAGELSSEEEEEGEGGLGGVLPGGQAAAAAAAGAAGPGRAAAGGGGAQQRQPLLPAACALALLPRGGRSHAPTALQHLMDDNSPLADIYAVCDTCTDLGRQMGVVSRDLHHVRRELLTLRRLLGRMLAVLDESYQDKDGAAAAGAAAAGEGPARSTAAAAAAGAEPGLPPAPEELMGFSLEHEVVRIQAAINARYEAELSLKATMAALSRVQQDHYAEEHPYKPFPTAELEAAVAAVPLSKHPWRERRLMRFGRDLLFRRGDAAESADSSSAAAAAAADVGGSNASVAAAAELASEAPAPKAPMTEQWLRECAAFASTYYRFVDRSLFHNPRAQGILRETLPMHREPLRYAVRGGASGMAGGGGIRHSSSGSRNSGGGGGGFRSGGSSSSKAKPAAPSPSPGRSQPYSSAAPMAALQAGAARLGSKAGAVPGASPPLAALHLRLRPQYSSPVSPGAVQQLLRQCSRLLPGAGTRRLLSCLR